MLHRYHHPAAPAAGFFALIAAHTQSVLINKRKSRKVLPHGIFAKFTQSFIQL